MSIGAFSQIVGASYSESASRKEGKDMYQVDDKFIYHIGSPDSSREVRIPKGFLTDGATVPRIFWSVIPPWGAYGQAAIVHDFLCNYHTIWEGEKLTFITESEVDSIFYEAMTTLCVPYWKRRLMYVCVRIYHQIKHDKYTSLPIEYANQ